MHKSRIFLIIVTLILSQSLFARDISKSCRDVAKACTDAGYTKDSDSNKEFWHNCMKPILLKKKIDGVTLDEDTIKTCRSDKIKQLKNDLDELKKAD